MAAPGGKFFIQDKLQVAAPHHQSFKQLWETKWKMTVSKTRRVNFYLPKSVGNKRDLPLHVWSRQRLQRYR
jgi:hypothetical protein